MQHTIMGKCKVSAGQRAAERMVVIIFLFAFLVEHSQHVGCIAVVFAGLIYFQFNPM